MKNPIITTYDVAKTIIRSSAKFDVETGGVLIGTFGDTITIVAAGIAGENAVHHATSFTSDAVADKACLKQTRKIYGNRVEPLGWWHKHPPGYSRPSDGDCRQVRQLAAEYNDGKPVLMGIVNRKDGAIAKRTFLHIYSIDNDNSIIEHNWKLIRSNNKELLDAIRQAPVKADTVLTNYWTDENFQAYLNPIGRERIKRDIEKLKDSGWQVQTALLKQENLLVLDLSNNRTGLRMILPPEFPLNPPTILTGDGRIFHSLKTVSRWNSQNSLTQIAVEASAVVNCSRCSKHHISPEQKELSYDNQ